MNMPLEGAQVARSLAGGTGTHEVLNQAKPATGFNAFSGDAVLREAVARHAP